MGLDPLVVRVLGCDGTVLEHREVSPREGPTIRVNEYQEATVVVANRSTSNICKVHVRWGREFLREDAPIVPGERRALFMPGPWRPFCVDAVDCAGHIVETRNDFEIRDMVEWTIDGRPK